MRMTPRLFRRRLRLLLALLWPTPPRRSIPNADRLIRSRSITR